MSADSSVVLPALKENRLFQGLDDAQLAWVAEAIIPVNLEAGEELPLDEELEYPFYAVTSGLVQITKPINRKKQEVFLRKREDYFGAELLLNRQNSLYTVLALQPTRLFQIYPDDLQTLLAGIPQLRDNLREVRSLQSRLEQKRFSWVGEDEVVYLVVREHIAYLVFTMLYPLFVSWLAVGCFVLAAVVNISAVQSLCILLGSMAVVVSVLWAVWRWIDWHNDFYIVTSHRLVWLEHVVGIYDSRREVPIAAIKASTVFSNFWGRRFGYGDVMVEALMGRLAFQNIADPEKVKRLIDAQQYAARKHKAESDLDAIKRILENRIPSPQPIQPVSPQQEEQDEEITEEMEAPAKARPVPVRRKRLGYFQTRIVEGDSVTYRKHLFVLFTKVWLPTLILILLIALVVFSVNTLNNLTLAMLALGLMLIPALFWLYFYADWRNDIYRVTSDKIIDSEKRPLGTEITKSAPIENIQSMDYARKGIIGNLLNFGDVVINVGTDTKFTFDGIHNPALAQQDVYAKVYEYRRKKDESEASKERERFTDWFVLYNQLKETQPGSQNSSISDQNSG